MWKQWKVHINDKKNIYSTKLWKKLCLIILFFNIANVFRLKTGTVLLMK